MRSKMVLVFDGLENLKEYYDSEYTILKPMPEKKPISQDRGNNHCEYSLLDRLEYQKGWNDCIDMLLGEEE